MKNLISIFFIALTLSGEAVTLGDLHSCEWVRSETCSAETLEGCEIRMPVARLRSHVRNVNAASLVFVAPVYPAKESKDNLVNRLYHQHRFRKNASPVYLSNQVFLI